ncbi:hypothetical protein LCI18_011818 [Fusarium solani-melongenae]|uniref:Uncharacterized protein n=1 Tax=Fusarium solani subsp. cucurbitae TaxID=2747967 RepID=A0ACD3ZHT8_FUSSC|nr:hypothetical protein LCI18_011818 [Fusarium solani-melongenae]
MDTEPTQGSIAASAGAGSAKRRRLNFACNYCRARKTRCDEQQPSCQACLLVGAPCVTEDRRKPGQRVQRREAGKGPDASSTCSASPLGEHRAADADNCQARSPVDSRTASITPLARPDMTGSESGSQAQDGASTAQTLNNRLPIWCQSEAANSFEILTEWLDLAFHRLSIPYRVGVNQSTEYMTLSPRHGLVQLQPSRIVPDIPDAQTVEKLIQVFKEETHTFFPVLRLDLARAEALKACVLSANTSQTETIDLNLLRTLLLLAAGGFHQQEQKDFTKHTLTLARDSLGHLIGSVTIDTVEVLFLLSVCLRLNDELASAWTTLGLCISLAACLGLHRPSAKHSPVSQHRHPVWWAIYSYEKFFSFQLGHMSSIPDEGYDSHDDINSNWANTKPHEFVLTMARVLSKVSRRCVEARRKEDLASNRDLEAAIKEKVHATGESLLMLVDWAEGLPLHLRPTSNSLPVSQDDEAIASFISLYYHNAILMVSRNCLLISNLALHKAVEIIAKGSPWEHIIRNGKYLVASSARKMVNLLAENEGTRRPALVPCRFSPLHAFYVLAIGILKHPGSRVSRIDQSLLETAADMVRSSCLGLEAGRLEGVIEGVLNLTFNAITAARGFPQSNRTVDGNTTESLGPSENSGELLSWPETGDAVSLHGPRPLDPGPFVQVVTNTRFDPNSEDMYTCPMLPDKIGCDWAPFQDFLARLEEDDSLPSISDSLV